MRVEFIDPGAFRSEMRLMQTASMPDGLGGRTESWSEIATVFAQIEPRRAIARFGADQPMQTVTHRITLRARSDIKAGMRLLRGERIFEIDVISDPDESGRYLVLEARETRP